MTRTKAHFPVTFDPIHCFCDVCAFWHRYTVTWPYYHCTDLGPFWREPLGRARLLLASTASGWFVKMATLPLVTALKLSMNNIPAHHVTWLKAVPAIHWTLRDENIRNVTERKNIIFFKSHQFWLKHYTWMSNCCQSLDYWISRLLLIMSAVKYNYFVVNCVYKYESQSVK